MKYIRKEYIALLGVLILAVCIGAGSGSAKRASSQEETETAAASETAVSETEWVQESTETEVRDVLPGYEDLPGFYTDGILKEQQKDWRLTLVNKWNIMEEGYEPELAELMEGHQVDARIAEALMDMIHDAKKAGYAIYILSSYREMEHQIELFEEQVKGLLAQGYSEEEAEIEAGTVVAYPGTSEHQLGLAVDLVSSEHISLDEEAEKTKGYQWLVAHCQEYGFILRYPDGTSEITGIIYEPWHFRYVGEEAAAEIMERGITLEQYLGELAEAS